MSAYLWRSKVKMKIDCNIKSNIVKLPKTNLFFLEFVVSEKITGYT